MSCKTLFKKSVFNIERNCSGVFQIVDGSGFESLRAVIETSRPHHRYLYIEVGLGTVNRSIHRDVHVEPGTDLFPRLKKSLSLLIEISLKDKTWGSFEGAYTCVWSKQTGEACLQACLQFLLGYIPASKPNVILYLGCY